MTTAEIRDQIKQYIDQLSPERLQVAADFLAYLADRESEEATEELLKTPGFVETFEKAEQDVAKGNLTDWRKIRRDV